MATSNVLKQLQGDNDAPMLVTTGAGGGANVTIAGPDPLNVNVSEWIGSTAPSVGQKTSAQSLPVTIASDQSNLPITLVCPTANQYTVGIVDLVIAANPTDVLVISGSATKTVRIIGILFDLGNLTSNNQVTLRVVKRSSANTGGTSTLHNGVSCDSTSPAATATVRAYTANPTVGAQVGIAVSQSISNTDKTNPAAGFPVQLFSFGMIHGKACVLRGVNESVAINFNGVAIANNSTANATVVWQEE